MHFFKSFTLVSYILLNIFSVQLCRAAEPIEIVKSDGHLTVSDLSGNNTKSAKIKDTLPATNILSTGADGRAVVRVGTTGYIVLEKNSKVEINTSNDHAGFFRQITGMIYYAINSIKKDDHTLEVRVKTATMGIRGTRFIVNNLPDSDEVGMRKGTLSVSSPNEDFEIHKKLELDEFEALKRESQAAIENEKDQFEKFKENTRNEFVEYKHEFELGKDRMVTIGADRKSVV